MKFFLAQVVDTPSYLHYHKVSTMKLVSIRISEQIKTYFTIHNFVELCHFTDAEAEDKMFMMC